MNFHITITKSKKLNQAPQVVQANLDQAITEATLFLDAKVKANTPQGVYGAQGGLLGSIQNEVTGRGTPIVKGRIMTAHKYAEVIEKGRRPGQKMPPGAITMSDLKSRRVNAQGGLVQWIMLKFGVDIKTAMKLEFVVRRSIGKKGFKGAHMFEKALTDNWPQVQSIFDRCGFKIAKELSE